MPNTWVLLRTTLSGAIQGWYRTSLLGALGAGDILVDNIRQSAELYHL